MSIRSWWESTRSNSTRMAFAMHRCQSRSRTGASLPYGSFWQIAVQAETVTVATGASVPAVSTETSENQNTNAIDRDALDRIPVFDLDVTESIFWTSTRDSIRRIFER